MVSNETSMLSLAQWNLSLLLLAARKMVQGGLYMKLCHWCINNPEEKFVSVHYIAAPPNEQDYDLY